MAEKAIIVAFVFSLLGATYQMVSIALAYLVDRQFPYYYYIGLYSYFNSFAILVIFWAIAHFMDKQDSRMTTWSGIILSIGVATLANLIIALISPINTGFPGNNQPVPFDIGAALLPAPLLLILGGIFGFVAARRMNREKSLRN